MIVLQILYICALRKKSVPLLPGGTVKYTLLAPEQIHVCLLTILLILAEGCDKESTAENGGLILK